MDNSLANFLYEMRQLREVKRSGWQLIGIPEKESVAEHSLRAAQIGYILAVREGYENPEKVAAMLIFHDIGEARVGDIHKVANRYITEVAEGQAVRDQTEPLDVVGTRIYALWEEVEERSTKAGIIAKDADYLDAAFTAKEYVDQGHMYADDWITNVGNALKTQSAKELWESMKTTNANDWWQGLKKLS